MSRTPRQDGLTEEAIGADLANTWEREIAKRTDPVFERITDRPSVKHLYEWALEQRDRNAPRPAGWFSGGGYQHAKGQNPDTYAYSLRCIRLIDEFSELAEERLEEDFLHPEQVVPAVLEELVKQKSRSTKKRGLPGLQRDLEVLCEISQRYRKDVA
jgi:hypothetical protein